MKGDFLLPIKPFENAEEYSAWWESEYNSQQENWRKNPRPALPDLPPDAEGGSESGEGGVLEYDYWKEGRGLLLFLASFILTLLIIREHL